MTKKLKHIVSISLVIVLLAPLTTQLFDSLFHHHLHIFYPADTENHFQHKHNKCPIPDFQLSLFSLQKAIKVTEKTSYSIPIIIHFRSDYYSDNSEYSFLLRAPPIPTRVL